MSQARDREADRPVGASSLRSECLDAIWRGIVTGRSEPIGEDLMAAPMTEGARRHRERQAAVAHQAVAAGLFDGEKSERLAVRITRELLETAEAKSGIASQTQLIEYALSKVALEDDFGQTLVARKGRIPDGVEF